MKSQVAPSPRWYERTDAIALHDHAKSSDAVDVPSGWVEEPGRGQVTPAPHARGQWDAEQGSD